MSEQKNLTKDASESNLVAGISIALILGSLIGYYGLATQPLMIRLGVLVGGIVIALGLVAVTPTGKRFLAYAKDSVNEVKKVVWPSRKETTQMTLIVFAFVVVMAIFLWSADKIIEWLIFAVFLGWK
ncbi:protein translocase subunit SecE [Polynucleobacter sp. SHI8]|uniref:preprotein translocase subunit SecE n=1 Tax=unclassified Polynucleobacter TaxID=2640945 RepID=UPI0024912C42|nr:MULTISPECIES: preprotein translocase subunit SecE [unclassified Polynucleobacter]BDW09959.1 protein translocase subunit SecE [Polynucleobacter sp. SHI2]BDW12405.1 protein translocase subunit SecE [Polynucleobacter sp. SHI8]